MVVFFCCRCLLIFCFHSLCLFRDMTCNKSFSSSLYKSKNWQNVIQIYIGVIHYPYITVVTFKRQFHTQPSGREMWNDTTAHRCESISRYHLPFVYALSLFPSQFCYRTIRPFKLLWEPLLPFYFLCTSDIVFPRETNVRIYSVPYSNM